MNFEQYHQVRQQNPEYIAAEKELKLILDLADKVLDLRLEKGWWGCTYFLVKAVHLGCWDYITRQNKSYM